VVFMALQALLKGKSQASRRFVGRSTGVFRLKGFYLSTPCQYPNTVGIDTGIPGFSCPGRFCQYRQYLEGRNFLFFAHVCMFNICKNMFSKKQVLTVLTVLTTQVLSGLAAVNT